MMLLDQAGAQEAGLASVIVLIGELPEGSAKPSYGSSGVPGSAAAAGERIGEPGDLDGERWGDPGDRLVGDACAGRPARRASAPGRPRCPISPSGALAGLDGRHGGASRASCSGVTSEPRPSNNNVVAALG